MSLIVFASSLQAADVTVTLHHVVEHGGLLRLGLFADTKAFEQEKPQQGWEIEADASEVTATFSNVAAGRYVLAVFQDHNANQQLDKNFFGIPKELYGFSHYSKAGKPDFAQAAFELSAQGATLNIELR